MCGLKEIEMKKVVRCRGVLFSGNAANGTYCGFVYANANNAPSNANTNIGSRKCLKRLLSNDGRQQKKILFIGNLATKTAHTCVRNVSPMMGEGKKCRETKTRFQ